MKTKEITIDGATYTVRELSMEEGFPLFSAEGKLDMPSLIRAAVTIDGRTPEKGEISLSTAIKLMPHVNELNSFGGGEGNG